jgi:hypothetical protein
MTYMICTACEIHHYEDCSVCFGFGFHGDGTIMSAADACNRNYIGWMRCYECGSTPLGVPTDYDEAFKQRVLETAEDDIVHDITTGWAFWPWCEDDPKGYWTAAALRVIADELDRRDDQETI